MRFVFVDPLADQMSSWSPYNYTFNNPINLVDPNGRMPIDPINGMQKKNQFIANTTKSFLNRLSKIGKTIDNFFVEVKTSIFSPGNG